MRNLILSNLGKDRLPGNRKTRWSQARREQGRCFCGEPTGKSLCPKHLAIQRERMNKRRREASKQKRLMGNPYIITPLQLASDNRYNVSFSRCFPDRFLSKIEIDAKTNCWNWTAAVTNYKHAPHIKYGIFSSDGTAKGTTKAHQYAYRVAKGLVPEGLEIDHVCQNSRCVNPAHLEAVTHSLNCLRRPRSGPLPGCEMKAKAATA